MERIQDTYLTPIESVVSFSGKRLLEIGCGNGSRTVQIAERCHDVVALDPDTDSIVQARKERARQNVIYQTGSANRLAFEAQSFDIVFFTLSFHHVPLDQMSSAIDEAVRVVKQDGYIIFLEPFFLGSFFEAEIRFNACDGDERKEKAAAYAAMLGHSGLQEVAELLDETVFKFDGVEDFLRALTPKQNSGNEIETFLEEHRFILNAQRRINIFRPRNGFSGHGELLSP